MKSPIFALAALLSAAPAHAATVLLTVDGIEVGKGVVRVALCDKGPIKECRQFSANQPALAETVGFRFENIPEGSYAFVGYQDMNSDNENARNLLGMPKEPFALSNNAGENLIPPPDYEDLALPVIENQENVVGITLQTLSGTRKSKEAAVVPIELVPTITVPSPDAAALPVPADKAASAGRAATNGPVSVK